MKKLDFKKWDVAIAILITGIWGGLATYWAYPQIKDQLFIHEKEQNHAEASALLVQMLEEGMLASSPERIEQLAQSYLAGGETQKVEELYNKHNLSESYFSKIIQSYRQQLDHPNLLRMLLVQQERTPADPAVREEIAQLYQWLKNDSAAIQQLKEGIQQYPEQYDFYEPLAQIYFRLKQEDQAFAVYQQRARQFKKAELWEQLSEAYLWKKNAKLSEEALLQAVALEPSLKHFVRLAQFYSSQGKNKPAQSAYLQATRVFEQQSDWQNDDKLLALQSYDFLEQYKKTASLLQSVSLTTIPENHLTFYFYIVLRAGSKEAAASLFQRLSNSLPENFERIHFDYALFSKDLQSLLAVLEKLNATGKATKNDWQQLAVLAFASQRPQTVKILLQKRRLPVAYWKELGNHYFDHQKTEQGLESHFQYAKAVNTIVGWRELVNLYFFKKKDQEGLAIFHQEIAKKYNTIEIWRELVDLYFFKKKDQEGLAVFHQEIAEKYNTIEIWRELVNLYFFKKKDQEGLAVFHQEIAEKFNQAPLWKELAELYFWKQSFSKGETALKRAIQMQPQLEWMRLLAQHYESRQKLSDAEQWYQNAIPLYPSTKVGNFEMIRFYMRNNMAVQAAPIMWKLRQNASQQRELTIEEQLEALQVFRFSNQTEWALQTLSEFPPDRLPQSELPDYFNLAFYEKKYPLAQTLLEEWGHNPSPPFWQKVLEFASQSPLTPELEKGLRAIVEESMDLKTVQQLARYYENLKRLRDAEHFYHKANTLSEESKSTQLDLVGFYIRHNLLNEAVPVMITVQQEYELSLKEQLSALDLYTWTGQTPLALTTLAAIPLSNLPQSKLPIYFDLAFFGKNYPLAQTILKEWGNDPSPQYWQKILAFASQSPLDAEQEQALRATVETSDNLQWVQQLAQYYENINRLSDAEHFYHKAVTLNDEKITHLELVKFYIRQSLLDEAVPVMTTIQQQYELSLKEQLDALDLYTWTTQADLALKTLSPIPLEDLPPSKLPIYFDLAFFGGDYSLAQTLLKEWGKAPSSQYWQKVLDFALQSSLEPEQEQALRTTVEASGNLQWIQQLAQYYENTNRLSDAEYFHQKVTTLQDEKKTQLNLAKFYIRHSLLDEAVPVMRTVQEQYELSLQEQLDALDLYTWTSQTPLALKTLSLISPLSLPRAKLPIYFDIAFFGKDYPLAQTILKEWGKTPSSQYWQKMLDFALLSPLDAEQEKGVRAFVMESGKLKWTKQLAQSYETQGQLEKAEEFYQQAISLSQGAKAEQWNLTQFYLRVGWLPQAVPVMQNVQKQYQLTNMEQMQALSLYLWTTQLDSAVATLPKVPLPLLPQENLKTYFDLAIFGGDLEKAGSILARWSQTPSPAFREKQLAFAMMQGQTKQALTIVQEEIQERGETIELLEQLYKIYESDQDRTGQINIIEKVLLRTPDDLKWLNRAINYYRFHQDYERAVSFLTQLFEQAPLPSIRKLLIWALLAKQSETEAKTFLLATPQKQWDPEFEQLALDVGYALQDLPLLAEHLQKRYQRQQDLEDLEALVVLFEAMKKVSLELRYSKELLRVQPSFENHVHYVDVLYRAKNRQLADTELTKLASKAKEYEQVKAVAELAENREDPSLALNSYRRLLEWEPDDFEILKQYGRFLADHEKYSEAIPILERYLKLEPDDLPILHRVALLYPFSDFKEEQNLFFTKLVHRFQGKTVLQVLEKQLYASGLAYTGRSEEAIRIFRQILQDDPEQIQVFEQFTGMLFQLKEYETLLMELEHPLSKKMDREQYYLFKSSSQKILDRKTESIQTLKEWVQKFPRNEQAWIDLAYSYMAIRNHNQAEKAFQQARKIVQEGKKP